MFELLIVIFSLVVCFLGFKVYQEYKMAQKRKGWARFKNPVIF